MVTKAKPSTIDQTATIEDLSAQMDVLKEEIAALTSLLGAYTKAQTERVGEKIKSTAADMKEAGLEESAKAQEKAEEFILTQPTTALGIAAGIGFLVGLATARR